MTYQSKVIQGVARARPRLSLRGDGPVHQRPVGVLTMPGFPGPRCAHMAPATGADLDVGVAGVPPGPRCAMAILIDGWAPTTRGVVGAHPRPSLRAVRPGHDRLPDDWALPGFVPQPSLRSRALPAGPDDHPGRCRGSSPGPRCAQFGHGMLNAWTICSCWGQIPGPRCANAALAERREAWRVVAGAPPRPWLRIPAMTAGPAHPVRALPRLVLGPRYANTVV
jgi:hypothetical protein